MKKLLFALLLAGCVPCVSQLSNSQAVSQYPVADKIADKIIQKYQTSSCEQLKEQKQKPQSTDATGGSILPSPYTTPGCH